MLLFDTVKFNSGNEPRDLYFSQDFFEGLYLAGLIIGGKFAFQIGWAYNWKEICVSNFSCANDTIGALLTKNS